MRRQINRAQITNSDFRFRSIQGNFRAQIGAMHYANMLLRTTNIARILESNPGMPGLEQHGQHLAPQSGRRNLAKQLKFASCRLLFITHIGLLEFRAKFVMQIRAI